ncbi:hypothetical protein NL108_015598 [Boleophthalmus pectinirostris]|nr:hypothetical protein NL108_015598 [Boleophthalmus pectinirostris]
MSEITICSYNVKGLGHPIKRKKIMNQLKSFKCSIALLQETHLSDLEHKKLKRDWADQIFFASCPQSRKRGVAILFNRNTSFATQKEIKDPQGRYIMIIGSIDGIQTTIINIYAPNEDESSFFTKVASVVAKESKGMILCAGDFNCVLDPKKDRLPPDYGIPTKKNKAANYLLEELGLVDVWRVFNPQVKDFTFYSNVHGSYSRIDLICLTKQDIYKVTEIKLEPITLSDHGPVRMSLSLHRKRHFKYWRLNVSILSDKDIQKQLKDTLKEYFLLNDNGEVSLSTLWDGAKAVLRGKCIEVTVQLKKQRLAKQIELESEIKRLEQIHKITRDPTILTQLKIQRNNFDRLMTYKAEGAMRFTNQKYYEMGNRASRLLAFQLRKTQASRVVTKIKHPSTSEDVTHPEKIAEAFRDFYEKLYTSDTTPKINNMNDFFKDLALPKLLHEEAEDLTKPITEKEIEENIKLLKNNKSPGPDGLSGEFYKAFIKELVPILGRVYNYALKKNDPPISWSEAIISVIHKEGKNPKECASYRPISLLGNDVKILGSILTKRMQAYIGKLIKPDQTGFIVGRQASNNIRRALNIQIAAKKTTHPSMLLALDAEKAFDRVDWAYLNYTMEKFGFDQTFIGWINTINKNPKSRIRVNGYCSEFFEVKRGVRQGSPTGPILFALSIEPLAEWVRTTKQIEGIIDRTGEEHKISLFADDILLYIKNPLASIPHLMQCLGRFGDISGYKVNKEKSEAMMMSGCWPNQLNEEVNFRWSKEGFRYLGVILTPETTTLYSSNYKKLISQVKIDIERWQILPLSLMGRIETIRMNVLPRFLFLFHSLPVAVPQSTFKFLDRLISAFIWQNKRPRVRLKVLHSTKDRGGLALPHLKSYYWAAQLKALVSWSRSEMETKWLSLEQSSVVGKPLSALLFMDKKQWKKLKIQNDCVLFTLGVWGKIRKQFKLPISLSRASKIIEIADFLPARLDGCFTRWANNGLTIINQLIKNTVIKSFSQIQQEFNIPSSDLFRFFQIRHYIEKHKEYDNIRQQQTTFEQYWIDVAEGKKCMKKIISTLYKNIRLAQDESTLDVKNKWELELNVVVSDMEWENAWEEWQKCLSSQNWREYSWKLRMRFFKTPIITATYNRDISALCWRKCGHIGDFSHIFWECPVIKVYWDNVTKEIKKILNINTQFKVQHIILCGTMNDAWDTDKMYMLKVLILIAHKVITANWLKPLPPTVEQWTQRLRTVELYGGHNISTEAEKRNLHKKMGLCNFLS